MRYILLWSDPEHCPFNYLGEGRATFKERNCSWTNCYVTSDRNHLGDYTEFEAVAFNGPDLPDLRTRNDLPKRRSPRQKYVYVNIESAANYPICTKSWDFYFNWTWTYRLDSDLVWKYFVIRNSSDHVIGPSASVAWTREADTEDIDEALKEKLKSKKKAAAWFVSNCDTQSLREDVVKQIREYTRAFNLVVDIYGECGELSCPKPTMRECLKILEKNYYFYFAFENSLSDDYVTEKVLHALNHNTVPVVYGGADYKRFLPPGSYLDARELGPRRLVEIMHNVIRSPDAYHSFFRWKQLYRFEQSDARAATDVRCELCAALNGAGERRHGAYSRFQQWWTPHTSCRNVFVVKIH
ncbi:unnamed protein product [Colias eurytheme]|nr:unnamed protein product [Colias eurytheme]